MGVPAGVSEPLEWAIGSMTQQTKDMKLPHINLEGTPGQKASLSLSVLRLAWVALKSVLPVSLWDILY